LLHGERKKERKKESIIVPMLHAHSLIADAIDPHQLTRAIKWNRDEKFEITTLVGLTTSRLDLALRACNSYRVLLKLIE